MAVANNADDYAAPRQNWFFPANNETPADGNLTAQCVTLDKWFFNDMCTGFPAPFAARGNAKDVGHTLVAQGLAVEVPFAERRRGDIICYEYGTYGHTAVQLSGGRVFESNVNWSGVASRVVDGETVYASRIGSEAEAWRATKNAHVYRLKSYNEGAIMADFQVLQQISQSILGRNVPVTQDWYNQSAEKDQDLRTVVMNWTGSQEARNFRAKAWDYDRLAKEYADYQKANPAGGGGDPDEHALAEAVRKVVSK